jgi:transposase InsO family protein
MPRSAVTVAKKYRRFRRRLDIRQSVGRTDSCLDGGRQNPFLPPSKRKSKPTPGPEITIAQRDIESCLTEHNYRLIHSAINYQQPATMRQARQARISMVA